MLRFQPGRVATGVDEDGMLVWSEERLVAVLVRLSEIHAGLDLVGHWFLETGYGRLDVGDKPTFADLDAARAWIAARLGVEG
ncbi:MAG TPA: hypothetical protein VEA41_00325 [Salinarimonas sp.]|jgi:hypothetical protein|nr:hypothetical protein [Salinarimonas sp.]